MDHDVIALGETMLALAPERGRSMVDAPTLLVDHAGAESNTCVGLARLGLRTAWVSRLGSDAAGDRIAEALRREAVDLHWVERDPMRRTGLMLKDHAAGVTYYRSESAASVMAPALLDRVPVADARAVLVTGVTALLGPLPHAAGLALLERARGLRIVDPNLRSGLWGSDRRAELVRPFVERCTLLLTGADELAEVLGPRGAGAAGLAGWAGAAGEEESTGKRRGAGAEHFAGAAEIDGRAEALARAATALGPREVVVRGASTIGALVDGTWHEVRIHREAAVDQIGAGDGFNAGYIAARLRGIGIIDALKTGVRCGTAVTTAISDTSGFPRDVKF